MYKIVRYPFTENRSLQPWSAADELLLDWVENRRNDNETCALFNDRFGYLGTMLHGRNPWHIVGYKSQEKALCINLKNNGLVVDDKKIIYLPEKLPFTVDLALVRVPKSMELFKMFLYLISQKSHEKTQVVCGFMTRYFTPQMLRTAELFFHGVEQSKARKKARLLILKGPKEMRDTVEILETVTWNGLKLQQYAGVFSASKVDFATRFLLENFEAKAEEQKILDLASGNGIIARFIYEKYQNRKFPLPELHLLDDAVLAIESSKLNMPFKNVHFHWDDTLDSLPEDYFDLIITNPPFHFEHEINTEVSLKLFREAYDRLHRKGRFVLVFNRHLAGYRKILKQLFKSVKLMADSPKYQIWECRKV